MLYTAIFKSKTTAIIMASGHRGDRGDVQHTTEPPQDQTLSTFSGFSSQQILSL